jgi:hypothetical protein
MRKTPAWTRSEGKNPKGGLNEKGRASYNAETVTLNLGMVNYNTEPFPAFSFTPSYFPGLF